MRDAGIMGKVATLYRRIPAGLERFYSRNQNLRLNAPPPTSTGQQWVGDLTYIKVGREWRYSLDSARVENCGPSMHTYVP